MTMHSVALDIKYIFQNIAVRDSKKLLSTNHPWETFKHCRISLKIHI